MPTRRKKKIVNGEQVKKPAPPQNWLYASIGLINT